MRVRRHESIKDSGLEWIGLIPKHWDVQLAKRLEKHANDLAQTGPFGAQLHASDYVDEGVPLILIKHVYGNRIHDDNMPRIVPERAVELDRYRVMPGDIVFSRVGSVGRIGLVTEEEAGWLISGQMLRLRFRSKEILPSFLMHAISSDAVLTYFDLRVVGTTRDSISTEILSAMPLPLPPLPEQRVIADFLDRKAKAIDDLIQKKERLSELLQEKWQALITQAVTKGLDPTVPMKDSGIEWLGDIPAHWDVAPVYARYQVQLGKMLDTKWITGDHLAPYLRNVDVQWDRINLDDLPTMDFTPIDRAKFALEHGDLLVCEGGEVGRCAVWQGKIEECYYQKALHRVRRWSDRDNSHFLYYVMFAVAKRDVFTAQGNLNTIDHLTAEKLRRYRFPFPPRREQDAISIYLDAADQQIATTRRAIGQQIDRLREYRQTLISAAVTGKIDVKETSNVASP